jgi:hypothetical protein
VRGSHVGQLCFDGGCVTGVLGQDIEVGQMTARAVKEEAEHLLEQLVDRRALGVLAHGAEETVEMRQKVDASEVASEEVEACPTRQAVVCDLDIVDEI